MPKRRNFDQNRRIGANMRFLRQDAGLTLEEVGNVLGVSMQQVHKYESGVNAPSLAAVAVLADLFGVPAETLFHRGATFPGGMECDRDVLDLCSAIVAIPDPVLRRKIQRVVEILAA